MNIVIPKDKKIIIFASLGFLSLIIVVVLASVVNAITGCPYSLNEIRGKEWLGMDQQQKLACIEEGLENLRETGHYVEQSPAWWVDQIDVYYTKFGDNAASDKLAKAVWMVGREYVK